MFRINSFLIIVILIIFVFYTAPLSVQTKGLIYFISTTGNDEWSGTLPTANIDKTDGPFATLERARDAILSLKQNEDLPDGGVTVYIREGTYSFSKTLKFETEDSGTAESPILFRAYRNEEVHLIGGKEITGFKPVENPEILNRLQETIRTKVIQVDLKAQGITDYGNLTPRGFGRPILPAGLELFFQGKPMTLARWPNNDFVRIASVPAGPKGGKFNYSGDRPLNWRNRDDIWVHGYWTWDWAESYERIKSIDTDHREISTYEPHGIYGYKEGKRFYFLNILEELDEPGEWYLDRTTGILYFYPPLPMNESKVFCSILETPLIVMENTCFITIRGIIFEYTRGNGVEIIGGNHNLIAGCTLRNIGNDAIHIEGGNENGIVSCDIYQTGDGGIQMSGGDRKSLTPGNNFVINNDIHDFSLWVRTYRPAVIVNGVGNKVIHNYIHDAPHMGIGLGGNEHLIEFNEISRVCNETSDVGAFYMGRDYTQRGNLIRYNYFHHLGKISEGVGTMAIYLDDWTSGTIVFGNVCYKGGREVLIGGGRDNIIENNIFIDGEPAIHIDARGLSWASYYFGKPSSWSQRITTDLTDKMNAVNFSQPPYSQRYPELLVLYDDDPAVPKGNWIIRNISIGGRWMDYLDKIDTMNIVHLKDNLINQDPGFIDPQHENFQLNDDSPAYKLGFKRIPIEKIGLYKDEYRVVIPVKK